MASQDNEKAMDGLLPRSLAGDAAAPGGCPDTELLAAYFERSLGSDEAARYELHFSQCARCREQLAALARAEAPVEADAEIALEPVLVTTRAMGNRGPTVPLGSGAPTQSHSNPLARPRPHHRLFDLRWLVPVAAALILGVFTYVRLMPREAKVAMNNENTMPQSPAPETSRDAQPASSASDASKSNAATNEPLHPPPATRRSETAPAAPAPMQAQTGKGAATRGGSISALAKSSTPKARAEVRSSAAESTNESAEPAPAAPPPELKGALPSIVVTTDAADAVAPPAPVAAEITSRKSEAVAATGRNLQALARSNTAAKVKAARERSTENVIRTPESNVLYRIAGGGFIEHSEDGGASWQSQLLNASSEFTAGSAPAPNTCWLVGRAGVIFRTEDGKNWKRISAPAASDLISVTAKDAFAAVVTTSDGQQWSTDDAGETWNPLK
ncbi:MAG: YCF48-related protein [Candidatus Acidiferrales bacterium]